MVRCRASIVQISSCPRERKLSGNSTTITLFRQQLRHCLMPHRQQLRREASVLYMPPQPCSATTAGLRASMATFGRNRSPVIRTGAPVAGSRSSESKVTRSGPLPPRVAHPPSAAAISTVAAILCHRAGVMAQCGHDRAGRRRSPAMRRAFRRRAACTRATTTAAPASHSRPRASRERACRGLAVEAYDDERRGGAAHARGFAALGVADRAVETALRRHATIVSQRPTPDRAQRGEPATVRQLGQRHADHRREQRPEVIARMRVVLPRRERGRRPESCRG